MKKLYILSFLIVGLGLTLQGQNRIDLNNSSIKSSTKNSIYASIPVNLNYNSNEYLGLNHSTNDWWQVELDSTYYISQVAFHLSPYSGAFYLIFSFDDLSIESTADFVNGELLNETLLSHVQSNYFEITPDGATYLSLNIPDIPANYITLIPANDFSVIEFEVDGDSSDFGAGTGSGSGFETNDDPNDGIEFGITECTDGLDNDNDGLIDCDEDRCSVQKVNIIYSDPSCGICNDGNICITAYNTNGQVSIDGGTTWQSIQNGTTKCLSGLAEGVFSIVLKSPSGCTKTFEVVLSVPRGPLGYCENGGFEDSSFENWTGGVGTISEGISNENFVTGRHNLINTKDFVDPIVPSINGDLPELGHWIVQLGNDENDKERERLKYCFDVDTDNQDFTFYYALVLQDPHDDESINPKLEWRIFRPTQQISPIVTESTISSDPFLDRTTGEYGEEIAYKGWTCVTYDLSDYLGEELCIQFDNFDCALGGHYGYSYIDGICGKGISSNPQITTSSDIFCFKQEIEVYAQGTGFNQFLWDIKVHNSSGSQTHSFQTQKVIGYTDTIPDLIDLIHQNSNNDVTCNSTITIGFTGFNDCGSDVRVEKTITYICSEYKVDYCDPLYICGGNNTKEVKIIGDVDCEGCQFSWTSSGDGGLNGTSLAFPTISETNWFAAFENTYYVEAITPEGCIFYDTVNVDFSPAQMFIDAFVNPCDVDVTVTIWNLEEQIDELSFIDQISGNIYDLDFDDDNSSESVLTFTTQIDRDGDKDLILNFGVDTDLGCYTQDIFECAWETQLFINGTSSVFQEPWIVFKPNIFAPLCEVDQYKTFYLSNETYFTDYTSNQTICDSLVISDDDPNNISISSIYYYRLQIFDRVGGLVFDEEISIPTTAPQGLDISTVKWDGYINGLIGDSAVYGYLATIKSCYSGIDLDNICDLGAGLETGNEETVLVVGDISLYYWHPVCNE